MDDIKNVHDLLYCDTSCSTDAHSIISDKWTPEYIKSIEKSKAISCFDTDDLSLMNRIFGSDAVCYATSNLELQRGILKLMPHDLYKNFRRATYKRAMAITVEDWLWNKDSNEFLDDLDIECTCLENVVVSLLLYLLGGFSIPVDDTKKKMDPWIKVDVQYLFSRPRELFLLTNMSPAILARYTYWKCTAVLMGLMRLFARKIHDEDIADLHEQLMIGGIDVTKIKNR